MAESKQKTPRWIKVTLFLSLAANLMVAGLVAGHFLAGGSDRERRGPSFISGNGPFLAAMERDDRRDFLRALRDQAGERDFDPRSRKESIRAMAAIISAEPFDAAALSAELAQQRQTVSELTATAQDAFITWVEALSAEERAEFAVRLAEQADRRPPR